MEIKQDKQLSSISLSRKLRNWVGYSQVDDKTVEYVVKLTGETLEVFQHISSFKILYGQESAWGVANHAKNKEFNPDVLVEVLSYIVKESRTDHDIHPFIEQLVYSGNYTHHSLCLWDQVNNLIGDIALLHFRTLLFNEEPEATKVLLTADVDMVWWLIRLIVRALSGPKALENQFELLRIQENYGVDDKKFISREEVLRNACFLDKNIGADPLFLWRSSPHTERKSSLINPEFGCVNFNGKHRTVDELLNAINANHTLASSNNSTVQVLHNEKECFRIKTSESWGNSIVCEPELYLINGDYSMVLVGSMHGGKLRSLLVDSGLYYPNSISRLTV